MSKFIQGQVVDLAHDGRGVVHAEEKTWFIPGALPGETISFLPGKKRKGVRAGVLDHVIEASEHRVEPSCEYFGVCGGCTLQHLAVEQQLAFKQETLISNLAKIGKVTPDEVLAPMQLDTWHYRRKARPGAKFVEKKGGVLVGFREQGSSYLTSLRSCRTLTEPLANLLSPLHEVIERLSCKTRIPQVEMAHGDNGITLVLRHLETLTDVDKTILSKFAADHHVFLFLQPGGLSSIAPINAAADQKLIYGLPDFDLTLEFEATDFVQVNGSINQAMIAQGIKLLDLSPDDVVADLFCGLGNFTLPIATRVLRVVGVEGLDALVQKGRLNAQRNGIENAEFLTADLHAETVASLCLEECNKFLLDPPRSGAYQVVTELLATRRPEKIVYVSCNPATLARDANVLVHQHGYKLTHAGAIDMFPHTGHVESMTVFTL